MDRDLGGSAAEGAFKELIERVLAAGWGAEETALNVLALTENHFFALLAHAEPDAAIDRTKLTP